MIYIDEHWLIIALLTLHFIGDFLFQSDWMAVNKSKSWLALATHCFVYSLFFLWFGLAFVAITFCLHFITDAITSRITSRLWFFKNVGGRYNAKGDPYFAYEGGNRHWFFVVIGFDQLIHAYCLLATFWWLS